MTAQQAAAEAKRRVAPKPPESSKELEILRTENEDLKRQLGGIKTDDKKLLADLMQELSLEKEFNNELKRRLDDKTTLDRQTLSRAMAQERVLLNDFLYADKTKLKSTPFPPTTRR